VKITHHLDDATVVAYAAGTLGEALSVVAASHVSLCAHCRAAVHEAEALGARLVEEQPAEAVSDMCRSATLASLDAIAVQPAKSKSAVATSLPLPLSRILDGKPLDALAWKTKGPGVRMIELPLSPGAKGSLKLLSVAPGKAMPEHGHGGEELTFILQGSYTDHTGYYQSGDIADLDSETEHKPIVNSDVACICLIATEAPTKFKSVFARLAQPFMGI
jgi:putative transcriptional regulator